LPGVDGKDYTLNSFKDKKVIVVLFTCNHCPYAQAYEDRLVNIQRDFDAKGVQFVAINPTTQRVIPRTVSKTWSSAPKKAI